MQQPGILKGMYSLCWTGLLENSGMNTAMGENSHKANSLTSRASFTLSDDLSVQRSEEYAVRHAPILIRIPALILLHEAPMQKTNAGYGTAFFEKGDLITG